MADEIRTRIRYELDMNSLRRAESEFMATMARMGRAAGGRMGGLGSVLTTNPISGGSRSFGQNFFAYLDRAVMGRGGAPGALGRLGAGMLGFGGGVNSLPAMATAAVGIARQQEQAYSNLNRRVGDLTGTYDKFRESVIGTGKDLGYTREQIIKLTDSYISSVGRIGTAVTAANLSGSMNLSKMLGIDPSIIVGAQGRLGRAGVSMGGGATPQYLNGAILGAITAGGMKGREEEVVKAITDLTDMLAQRIPTVTVDMFNSMAGLMTVFNATGIQGLMGARGAQLIGGLNGVMTGESGNKALMAMAVQRQGGGKMSLYDILYQMEEGAGNLNNRKALAGLFGKGGLFPGGQVGQMMLSGMSGGTISLHQANDIMGLMGQGGTFGTVADALTKNANATPALTEQDKATKAMTDFENSLTDLATKMLPVVTGSLMGMTNIVNLATGAMGAFVQMLNMNPFGGATGAATFAVDAFAAASVGTSLFNGIMPRQQNAVVGFKPLKRGQMGPPTPIFGPGPRTFRPGIASYGSRLGSLTRGIGPMALAYGAMDAGMGIVSGEDPWRSIGHAAFGVGGSLAGGALGSFLGPVGTIGGGVAGGLAGDALFNAMFPDNKLGLKGQDKLAQSDQIQQLIDQAKEQNTSLAMLANQQNIAAAYTGDYGSGGALDESARLTRRTMKSYSGVQGTIQSAAAAAGIDPLLALAVAQQESGFGINAIGDNGQSFGLFQENIHGRGAGRPPDTDPTRQTQRFAQDVLSFYANGGHGSAGQIAAAVQRPADAAGYARSVDAIYNQLRMTGNVTVTLKDSAGNELASVNAPMKSAPAGVVTWVPANN